MLSQNQLIYCQLQLATPNKSVLARSICSGIAPRLLQVPSVYNLGQCQRLCMVLMGFLQVQHRWRPPFLRLCIPKSFIFFLEVL